MNDRARHLPGTAAGPLPSPSQPDAALPVGMRLGTFQIQRVLSRSASAVVYAATDHALAMPVAIQEYLPDRLVRRDAGLRLVAAAEWHDALIARGLSAFVDDARLLAHCEHPSLVRVHQLFHSHGSAYRVMPLYVGQRLADLLREMASPPDEASLRALLDGLLGALETIHRSGRIHGGVSIDNILLLADDQPLLLGPGTASREIGSDLVESLMATLESPPDPSTLDGPAVGTPPTGAALDLYRLAEVLRFCIAGDPSWPPEALHAREPLTRVIARGLPAGALPPYSAQLLGALDAAVSPFAEDRPLSVAQFRDWLARGVPAVPGRGHARVAPPAASASAAAMAATAMPPLQAAAPAPPPVAAATSRHAATAFGATQTEPSFAADPASDATAPFAPWPEVVRAIDPPDATAPETAATLPPQLQRLTRARQRRYQWLMGATLALLAAGVLAIATGAWNRAPEIPLGPSVGRLDSTPTSTPAPPVAIARDTPVAAAAPVAAPPALPDPARTLAAEPPAAGPAATDPPPPPAPSASPEPVAVPEKAAQPAPVAPPARTAPRSRPPRTVAAAPAVAPAPRAACAGRTEFALYRCMQQQCQTRRFSGHPQCVRLHRDDRVD